MTLETLGWEVDDGVATVTLHRPKVLNAVNGTMAAELRQVLGEIPGDGRVRAVLLTGAGRGFCAGADLGDPGPGVSVGDAASVRAWLGYLNELLLAIMEMELPWVAAVNGPAAGMGVHLALACDLVLMAEGAYLDEAFLARGLVVDFGGMYLLPRLVGPHRAKEIVFFRERIDGPRALALGLANRVVPADALLPTAREWAERLARGPTRAIGLTRLGMNRGLEQSLREVLAFEVLAQGLVMQTEDVREGVRAFLDKREPVFKGK